MNRINALAITIAMTFTLLSGISPADAQVADGVNGSKYPLAAIETRGGTATLLYDGNSAQASVEYVLNPEHAEIQDLADEGVVSNTWGVETSLWNGDGTLAGCFNTMDGSPSSTKHAEANALSVVLANCNVADENAPQAVGIKKGFDLFWEFTGTFHSIRYSMPAGETHVDTLRTNVAWGLLGTAAGIALCPATAGATCVVAISIGVGLVSTTADTIASEYKEKCEDRSSGEFCVSDLMTSLIHARVKIEPRADVDIDESCIPLDPHDTWFYVEVMFYNQPPGSPFSTQPYDAGRVCADVDIESAFLGADAFIRTQRDNAISTREFRTMTSGDGSHVTVQRVGFNEVAVTVRPDEQSLMVPALDLGGNTPGNYHFEFGSTFDWEFDADVTAPQPNQELSRPVATPAPVVLLPACGPDSDEIQCDPTPITPAADCDLNKCHHDVIMNVEGKGLTGTDAETAFPLPDYDVTFDYVPLVGCVLNCIAAESSGGASARNQHFAYAEDSIAEAQQLADAFKDHCEDCLVLILDGGGRDWQEYAHERGIRLMPSPPDASKAPRGHVVSIVV